MPARLYTIPASAPFLETLIHALRIGQVVPGFPAPDDPLALSRATLYLPTRRACRLARETFLSQTGDAALLPRIVPIGDIDEDELIFADAATGEIAQAALELPPAMPPMERRLLLAQLIVKWTAAIKPDRGSPLVASTPAVAMALADDLARLMDDMTTRQIEWAKLDTLVPDALDKYWQLSLGFLKFIHPLWQAILAERGLIEPAARRDRLIALEAARLTNSTDPVFAAGSTGSMPSTAALLATIAKLPHGAVVLPGLDTDLDDTSWAMLPGNEKLDPHDGGTAMAGHPQFAMNALLTRIGVTRHDVTPLVMPAAHGREAFVSEALRPAVTTQAWQARRADESFTAAIKNAAGSITVIETANAEEEAQAIAVAMREVLQTEGKTAALVTPDRALARRVAANLERWHAAADDSGGDDLATTPSGVFARLAAETALGGLEPVTLLALLKHPLFRLGAGAGQHAYAIAALERAVLRGPRPRSGSAGLADALATFRAEWEKAKRGEASEYHRSDPRLLVSADGLDEAAMLVSSLAGALAPLEQIKGQQPLSLFATQHAQCVAALSSDDTGAIAGFAGADGEKLEEAFEELTGNEAAAGLAVAAFDYSELFHAAVPGRVERRPPADGIRLKIYGQLEARLQNVDRIILGGMVESVWPPETRSDPWLSRPMRAQLGLDLPERRIGLAAHDFAQALGTREVFLTRAAKLGGAPTVASRFVQRLAALAGEDKWKETIKRGETYLHWTRGLDHPEAPSKPVERPAPKPPIEARPFKLSVTDIEHWLRDPYTIYAKHVLNLKPLDPVDTAPGAADRGTVIHGAIGDFTKAYASELPADPLGELMALGKRYFAPLDDFPEARAFWWPRFIRIARWFTGWEIARRAKLAKVYGEIRGELPIPAGTQTFTLTARADRIEQRADGSYGILDYKTGSVRTAKQVAAGIAPQLTLEAAILRGGGFENVTAGPVHELTYVTLKGGDPAGLPKALDFENGTPDTHAERARSKLEELATKFASADEPYRSMVHPMWKNAYSDYDHLARVKEWSATGGEVEDDGR